MSEGPNRIDYQETPDITEVHAAVQREKAEPSAEVTPMPLWLTGLCALATAWAGIYFGMFHGGLSGNVYNEYESSPAVLFPIASKTGGPASTGPAQNEPLAQIGKGVFGQSCASCHQATGMGAAGQFPPLAGSDWVQGSEKRLCAILLKGLQGPVEINGKPFPTAAVMPPWETQLSPKKIAAVLTYVRQEWGNKAPEISEAKVKAAKEEFGAHAASWTQPELLQIPADATLPDAGGGGAPAPGGPAPADKTAAPAVAPSVAAPGPSTQSAPAPSSAAPTAPAPAAASAPSSTPAASAPAAAPAAAATPEQLAEGKKNYMTICFACHQPTGAGIPMVFPPLVKSPYVNGSPERLAAIILKGNIGPFKVADKPYNNIMPPQEAMLDDAKIASVMTYVRGSFENASGPVSANAVAAARKKFADRKMSWTQPELDAWKDDAAPAK